MKYSFFTFCILLLLLVLTPIVPAQKASAAIVEEVNLVTFPLDKTVLIKFVPDAKFPKITGEAKIDLDERGRTSIEAKFKKLPSVFDLNGLYSAYVLWAILPDGTTQRLGELKTKPKSKFSDTSIKTQIQLNTFGMIVTVEPHYLVRLPNRAVVMRGGVPFGPDGRHTESSTVTCVFSEEDYFSNRPKLSPKEEKLYRKTPISFIAAENAVLLAGHAGAPRYANDEYNESVALLDELKQLRSRKAKEREIELLANKIIGVAANAEKKAVENKIEVKKTEIKTTETEKLEAIKKALDAAEGKVQVLNEQLDKTREDNMRLRRDFDEKDSQSTRLNQENIDLRERMQQIQSELDKLKVDNEFLRSENRRLQNVLSYDKEFPILIKFMKLFGGVRQNNKELILTLPADIWSKEENASIEPTKMEKLVPLFKKIGESNFFQITVFSFVNSVTDPADGQELADARADSIAELFINNGVDQKYIQTKAFLQPKTSRRSGNRDVIEISFKLLH
jgi:outer membrane protein OmpA-like peptidoglycan-associated protein